MITLLIGLLAGAVVGGLFHVSVPGHPVWSVVLGLVGFFGSTLAVNLRIKKKLEAIFQDVQACVEDSQSHLKRRVNMMQRKNMSGGKGLQRRLEKEQAAAIREAIAIIDRVDPYKPWNLLAERQANTLRAQLYYQIKDFENADRYLESAMLMDPLIVAMKMARHYTREETEKLEKLFKKGIRRFKDEKGTLLYALYSWVLVKQDRLDEAVALLADAKEKTEDQVLADNWEHLANGRKKRFSNAGLGEQWYALHLETPKPIRVKQRRGRQF